MQQKQIQTVGAAIAAADTAISGATQYGAGIGLTHATGPGLTTQRNALSTAHDVHIAAKAEMRTRRLALSAMILMVLAFIASARDMLKTFLGITHSASWEQVGFLTSLALPRKLADIKFVLERMVTYFTANPARENEALNVTAARAQTLLTDLTAAMAAVTNYKTTLDDAKKDRDSKFTTLRNSIGGLFKELVVLLDPLDGKFLSFGFFKPGALSLPDVPTNVIVVLIGANAMSVKWNSSARAERYHIWTRVIGVDTEPVLAATRDDLDVTLEGLPSSAQIEVSVSAVNNGGESAKTPIVVVSTTA
jgi:hypothetical protein